MSTRGLLGFVHQGQVRAIFEPHSSYPRSLGREIVEFCNSVSNWDDFIHHYEKIVWIEEQANEKLPDLNGAKLLLHIDKGNVTTLLDATAFAEDSIFCEYAYVLNFDSKELEIYSNFFETDIDQSHKHLPMNLLAQYPLDTIPHRWEESLEMKSTLMDIDWEKQLGDKGIDIPDDWEL